MRYLICFIFIGPLFSCNWGEFKKLDPAFLKIDAVHVQNSSSTLETFHAVEDLWVFLDDVYIGTYPVLTEIPVLDQGPGKLIRIFPGIREFGIRSRAEIYNLMDPFTVPTDLQPGAVYSIAPLFKYKLNNKALFFEDFENNNQFINDLDQDKTNHLTRSTLTRQEGDFSGMIVNDVQHPVTEAGTSGIRIPTSAFLELSFKSTHDFNIGVNTINGSNQNKNYFLVLKATPAWKKVYIPLREVVDQNLELVYQLLIRSEFRPDPASPVSVDTLFLDYLKIISLP